MNREIKFRQWDSINKKMRHPYLTGIWGDQECYPLMQYTGRNDVTQVRIYDGDIVFSDYYYPEIVRAAIKYDEEQMAFVADSAEQDAFKYGNLVVVGNIHENPDLLEQSS